MMLTGNTKVILPPSGEFQREDMYIRHRWRRVQHLANEFWSRWRKEYLQNLQARPKWNERVNLKVGDVVITKDDNVPRNEWELGRIESVERSDDKLVMKARVRLATK